MNIKRYGMEDLAKARQLQQDALNLHLVPPPVLSWEAEVKDSFGEVIEKVQAKANSYVRNAYNIIAENVGFVSKTANGSTFGDGTISTKMINNNVNSANMAYRFYSNDAYIAVGTNAAPESLESYLEPTSGLTGNATGVGTFFNTETRKLITILSRSLTNNTVAAINIVEAAILMYTGASTGYLVLMVRDVFPAITVPVGGTLVWVYTTEVAYPKP